MHLKQQKRPVATRAFFVAVGRVCGAIAQLTVMRRNGFTAAADCWTLIVKKVAYQLDYCQKLKRDPLLPLTTFALYFS